MGADGRDGAAGEVAAAGIGPACAAAAVDSDDTAAVVAAAQVGPAGTVAVDGRDGAAEGLDAAAAVVAGAFTSVGSEGAGATVRVGGGSAAAGVGVAGAAAMVGVTIAGTCVAGAPTGIGVAGVRDERFPVVSGDGRVREVLGGVAVGATGEGGGVVRVRGGVAVVGIARVRRRALVRYGGCASPCMHRGASPRVRKCESCGIGAPRAQNSLSGSAQPCD